MEISYNKLRQKCVVSVVDGKNWGRVCDVVLCYPQNTVKGYFVTGGKGFKLTRQNVFIPVANIIKIGEDVVLTNFGEKPSEQHGACPPENKRAACKNGGENSRRSYEEYE